MDQHLQKYLMQYTVQYTISNHKRACQEIITCTLLSFGKEKRDIDVQQMKQNPVNTLDIFQ